MSGTIRGITPEENAALPGPKVDLPQVAMPDAVNPDDLPGPVDAEGRQVIEIGGPAATGGAAEGVGGAGGGVRAPQPEAPGGAPAAMPEGEAADAPAEAPQPDEAGGLTLRPGPRGSVVGTRSDVIPAGALREMLTHLGKVRPSAAPRARLHNFVRIEGRQIEVRAATEAESAEVADLLGKPAADTALISTRGAYMPTDVQEFIAASRAANPALYGELSRGVQTRGQQIAMAERLGLDGMVDKLLRRRAGETLNNEELIAGSVGLVNIKRETDESAAALLNIAPGAPDEAAALRRYALNHALAAAVSGQLNGAVAEAGRALGALRFAGDALRAAPPEQIGLGAQRLGVLGQEGPAGLRMPRDATDEAIVDMLGGADVIRTQAAMWAALPDAAVRNRFAQRSIGARSMDALAAGYVQSLLWLPTTHIKNVLGNTVMGLWQVPERFLAGMIGAGRSRVPFLSDERVYMGEALAQLYGIYQGFGDALRASGQVFRSGVAQDGLGKLELARPNAISAEALQVGGVPGRAIDLLGTVMGGGGRALLAGDAFFQTIGTRMELNAQAVRTRNQLVASGMPLKEAADEAASLLANPPEMWREAAESAARSMTFQQEMTGYLKMLDDVMQHPLAKPWAPFFRTPTNIARAVALRSPIGFAISRTLWADLRAGGATADLALSRVALGSGVMWWATGAVMETAADPNFRITGSEPTQPARRENFRRQGLAPFSVCHKENGGWTCRSYAGIGDPLSGLLAMAAEHGNYVLDHPNAGDGMAGDLEQFAMASASGLYEYMLDQPFLSAISEMSRVLIGPPAGDGRSKADRMMQLLTQQVAGAVLTPLTGGTLGAGIERAMDPTVRSTRPEDREAAQWGPVARGAMDAVARARARIPGQGAEMAPLLNVWGQPVQPTEGGRWELFWPIRTTSGGRSDALEETLMRLGGVIRTPESKFPGTDVELTAGQYNRLIRAMNAPDGGMTMREEMAAAVAAPDFYGMDAAEQMARFRRIYSDRSKVARERLLAEDADLARRVERDQEYRKVHGRSPRPDAPDAP